MPSSGAFTIERTGEPDAQLNAFVRINTMNEPELKACFADPQSCATLGEPGGAVNPEAEARACGFLEMRCKLLSSGYRTTPAALRAILAEPQLTWHATCAARLKLAELEILGRTIDLMVERGALEEEL